MASTNKTPQLGLNQWAAGDSVLREDFNRDNANLEKLVGAMLGMPVMGSFLGDGKDNREIALGFAPRFVIFLTQETNYYRVTFITHETAHTIGGGAVLNYKNCYRLTQTGFTVVNSDFGNMVGYTSYYIAFA